MIYRAGVRTVPAWALVSSAAAPVLLIGGWTLGAARQSGGFDPAVETISALAALDATDRWIMTAGLAGLGACHVVTATGLLPAAAPGRVVLALGGVATLLVAVFPQPVGGSSGAHVAAATVAFGALSVWPALAVRRRGAPGAVPALPPAVALGATAVLLALLGWFGAEFAVDGDRVGLTERLLAGAQALTPLAIAALLRLSRARRP